MDGDPNRVSTKNFIAVGVTRTRGIDEILGPLGVHRASIETSGAPELAITQDGAVRAEALGDFHGLLRADGDACAGEGDVDGPVERRIGFVERVNGHAEIDET